MWYNMFEIYLTIVSHIQIAMSGHCTLQLFVHPILCMISTVTNCICSVCLYLYSMCRTSFSLGKTQGRWGVEDCSCQSSQSWVQGDSCPLYQHHAICYYWEDRAGAEQGFVEEIPGLQRTLGEGPALCRGEALVSWNTADRPWSHLQWWC